MRAHTVHTSTFECFAMVFHCQFCCFSALRWKQVLRHTFEAHSSAPGFIFTCGVDGCSQTFRTYSGINSHLQRKHRGRDYDDRPTTSSASANVEFDVGHGTAELAGHEPDLDTEMGTEEQEVNQLEKAAALFLLCLKERYQLTQSAIDFAIGQVQQMLSFAVDDIQNVLEAHLQSCPLDASNYASVLEYISIPDPFLHLQSEYMQTKYFRENFDLIVS